MQYLLTVPKPCNEDWAQMTLKENGRHCAQCCKTVVDFTEWEPDAILQYLQAQGPGRTCGRFRESQLSRQESDSFIYTVSTAHAPYFSKLLAIFLLAFGLIQMSCNTDERQPQQDVHVTGVTVGKPLSPRAADTTNKTGTHVTGFTKPVIVAEKRIYVTTSEEPRETMGAPILEPEPIIQGDAIPQVASSDTIAKKAD